MYVLAILTVTSLINNFKKVIALQLNLRADGKKHVTAGLSLLKNSTNPRIDLSIQNFRNNENYQQININILIRLFLL